MACSSEGQGQEALLLMVRWTLSCCVHESSGVILFSKPPPNNPTSKCTTLGIKGMNSGETQACTLSRRLGRGKAEHLGGVNWPPRKGVRGGAPREEDSRFKGPPVGS